MASLPQSNTFNAAAAGSGFDKWGKRSPKIGSSWVNFATKQNFDNVESPIFDVNKIELFDGQHFKRWQQKLLPLLNIVSIQSVLTTLAPTEGSEDYQTANAWDKNDKIYKSIILNLLSNELFDVYCTLTHTADIWNALVKKYVVQDAGTKKYAIGNFLNFKMIDEKRRKPSSLREASKDSCGLTRELREIEKHKLDENEYVQDPFADLKHRFLSFKKKNCLENKLHYENLAEGQAPKFMVIACADSRVCPSRVLGFQPGEAFTVRNVANLVPPFEHGVSETSAALEFAVNSLQVANVLVVGHSRCGGIRALMSMKDGCRTRNFIGDWVSIAKGACLSAKAAAGNLSFEKQCIHCEKESINGSLLNLLTYPWIEKRVSEGILSLHGGYYDFVNCTFEKWTLVYREGLEGGSKYALKNRSFWS